MTTQVIAKQDPLEKVGNVVAVDGTTQIIEYSDLPDEHARRRDAQGELAIWAGSIAVHVFDVAFLQRVKDAREALPFHRAHKKVAYVDAAGNLIEPEQPNAIKNERFIFDLMPMARNALVVEVDEAQAFAPLKNAEGAAKDTAATAQAAMVAQHVSWLEAAGARVAPGIKVEINPRFAADPEELIGAVTAGSVISEDRYFGPPVQL